MKMPESESSSISVVPHPRIPEFHDVFGGRMPTPVSRPTSWLEPVAGLQSEWASVSEEAPRATRGPESWWGRSSGWPLC